MKMLLNFWKARFVYRLVGIMVGLFFLLAATLKVFSLGPFAKVIEAYEFFPSSLSYPAAVTLVVLEGIGGFGLLLDWRPSILLVTALVILFQSVLVYAIYQNLNINCACLGFLGPDWLQFTSEQSLYKNTLLLFGCGYLIYWNLEVRETEDDDGN